MVTAAMKLKDACSLEEKLWQILTAYWKAKTSLCQQSCKVPYCQCYSLSSSHVWIWQLDHKEGWQLKKWCLWIKVLEKTLDHSLDCKEVRPINPKGKQPWLFTRRTAANVEAPILWPPDSKSRLTGKDPDTGKDWRKRRGQQNTRWLDSITNSKDMNLEQPLGDSEGQGSLASCSRWGWKELKMT